MENYTWKPHKTQLNQFNAKRTCAVNDIKKKSFHSIQLNSILINANARLCKHNIQQMINALRIN